ncbi:glycosyltransferase [Vibrio parahaemolyticus]|nr:glycosyltransferase [Vibrio parahaemolyticus]EGR2698412.1 glycosyltransferase family 2 protein [Vibrio parahaemolyticus]EJE4179836.1 glycosyltransferase family 2 protein [Vibrio parahaemolyticus]MDG3416812.1 glycosyltransferase family 2 protein [Vibrio parahaemolyticus]HBC3541522.1 glycosyltransferase family 2 protein [Vibrio parahaemolyticus]
MKMQSEDKVSIVVPTYNVERLIGFTIDSVINQSYKNWELLLVDDCSSDNTKELLQKYAQKDNRIKCHFSSENLGAGGARNVGLSIATGRFIAFLDSDDLWSPNKLERQISFMKLNNAPISHTSFSFIDENGQERRGKVDVSSQVGLLDNLKRTEIATSTAVIDRCLVKDEFRFSLLRARQDLKLWIYLLGMGYNSFGLDENLVHYRVRKDSVSSNKWKMLYLTFKVYMSIEQLPVSQRFYCYINYVFNAIKKRGE